MNIIARIPWTIIIIACLTVGLAPYNPPHIWTKTILLVTGNLPLPVDWWDLFFHWLPWAFLVLKIVAVTRGRGRSVGAGPAG